MAGLCSRLLLYYESWGWSESDWNGSQHSGESKHEEPEEEAGDFGAFELNNFLSQEIVEVGDALKYVQISLTQGLRAPRFLARSARDTV